VHTLTLFPKILLIGAFVKLHKKTKIKNALHFSSSSIATLFASFYLFPVPACLFAALQGIIPEKCIP